MDLSLDRIPVGSKCKILKLLSSGIEHRRFLDLGFIKNTEVEVLYNSPFDDPVAYFIRGTTIALRNSDAKKVIVRPSIKRRDIYAK